MDFNRWNIFWSFCFGVMAFAIIVGNTLSISVLFKRRLRKRSHFLLINLAIADLMVGLFAIPLYMILFVSRQNVVSNLVYECVDMFTGLTSIFTLAVISLERLNAITRPFRHRQLTSSGYVVALATPWVFSLIVTSIRVLQGFFVITARQFVIVIILSLSAPLLISCIAHVIIWRKQTSRIQNEVQARMEVKLFRTLLLITALFVLSWLPFQVSVITFHLCVTCTSFPAVIVFVVKLLQYSNSFINFVIYCLRMPDYRNELFKMLPNPKCNHNRHRVLYPVVETETGISLISYTQTLHS